MDGINASNFLFTKQVLSIIDSSTPGRSTRSLYRCNYQRAVSRSSIGHKITTPSTFDIICGEDSCLTSVGVSSIRSFRTIDSWSILLNLSHGKESVSPMSRRWIDSVLSTISDVFPPRGFLSEFSVMPSNFDLCFGPTEGIETDWRLFRIDPLNIVGANGFNTEESFPYSLAIEGPQ